MGSRGLVYDSRGLVCRHQRLGLWIVWAWSMTVGAWSVDSNTVLSFPVSTLNNILEAWSMDSRGMVYAQ